MTRTTQRLSSHEASLAGELIRNGELVAIPTETVYGLAGDATNPIAVASIYEAKGRPTFNPLISHVLSLADAKYQGVFSETAEKLANAFWPGPLTLVVPARPDTQVCDLARAGLDTIAIRVPAHFVAREILGYVGKPVVAPSANTSGQLSPTTADHVADDLTGKIAAIIDGGPCEAGIESAVVSVVGDTCTLLRKGALTSAEIRAVVGKLEDAQSTDTIASPGMLAKHYAPKAKLRLNANRAEKGEVYLGFGPFIDNDGYTLSKSGDLKEAAANLFTLLHELDACGKDIAVAPIPEEGLGEAMNDRLRRAAIRD